MIPLAPDRAYRSRLGRVLRAAWPIAAAVALPLADLFRRGAAPDPAAALLALVTVGLLAGGQLVVLRIGPRLLRYEVRHEELRVHTALRTLRVPFEDIVGLEPRDGSRLGFRGGVSIPGYHVGWFAGPDGPVRVVASRISGPGLLVVHRRRFPLGAVRGRLFLSPAEPEVVRAALGDALHERARRVALGQP